MKFVELSVEELTEAVALFEKFHSEFADCFRTKTRDVSQQSSQYIQGQLLCLERGNMTNLTKVVPESDHQSFQQFLSDSPWKDEGAIENLQQQVTKLIGDAQESALHIDETGFLKQGAHSVGVITGISALTVIKRQYCGRLGKVDNCQVGVFLGYTFRESELSLTVGCIFQKIGLLTQNVAKKQGFQKKSRSKPKPNSV